MLLELVFKLNELIKELRMDVFNALYRLIMYLLLQIFFRYFLTKLFSSCHPL